MSFLHPARNLGRGPRLGFPLTSLGKRPPVPDTTHIDNLLSGDKRALARSITLVERAAPQARDLLQSISPHLGRSYAIGITGPPGAGKSSIVDRLASHLRARDDWNGSSAPPRIGILAADPTSPFTGGAILADRVRMQRHYKDPGVYIRSMATRGSQGGLPRCTRDAMKLLDAYGSEIVIVETVGVGQAEIDIMGLADTVIVTLVPEGGDAMQAMKAGLMEIADLFVVNKADRPGADTVVRDISAVISWDTRPRDWVPRVLSTQALKDVGIGELVNAILEHKSASEQSGLLARRRSERLKRELFEIIRNYVDRQAQTLISSTPHLSDLVRQVESATLDPHTAAQQVLQTLLPPRHSREIGNPGAGPRSC